MHGRTSHILAALALTLASLLLANPSLASEPWPEDYLSDAGVHDVQFLDVDHAWAVGDYGAILHSADGGATWHAQTSHVGDKLNSVHFIDALNGWAVGGSPVPHTPRGRGVVLRTDNGGQTWIVERNRSLPILRHVQFFDRKHGVAVGDTSSLYAAGAFTTKDGGRTWRPIPTRTAHGWISADFRNDGTGILLTAAGNITTYDGQNCRARSTPSRKRSGSMRSIRWIDDANAIAVGDRGTVWLSQTAGTTWQDISKPALEDTPDFRNVCSHGKDIWIVTSPGNRLLHSTDGCGTLRSVPVAGMTSVTALEIEPASGLACAAGTLGQIALLPESRGSWQIVRNANRVRAANRMPSEDRERPEPNPQQRALVQQVIQRAVADPGRRDAWLAQIENLSSRLSKASTIGLLYDYAQQQFASGDAVGAIRTLESLVARYGESDLTDAALRDAVLWLVSREVAHRKQSLTSDSAASLAVDSDGAADQVDPNDKSATAVATVSHEEPVRRGTQIPLDRLIVSGPTLSSQHRKPAAPSANPVDTKPVSGRSNLQQWISRMGPETVADPDIQLAIESYRRRTHKPGVRQAAVYQRLSRTLPGHWRDGAAAELALLKPERTSNKLCLEGSFGSRPHLDGLLNPRDKATWPDFAAAGSDQHPSIVLPMQSASVDASTPNRSPTGLVVLAADPQFLYIAVRCQQQPDADYTPNDLPRSRDADLTGHDRVDIFLDTDRDYSLAWRLTVDHRGWTGEALGSDASWNPQWYVATSPSSSDGKEWICEAAIAWKELAEAPPTAESPWGLTLVRTLPNGEQHHWPLRSQNSPQRFENAGLFHFR